MNSCAVTDDYNKSAHWAQAIKHIYTSSNLRTFGWAFKTWTPVPEFDWLTAHSLLAAPTSTLQALSAYQLPVETLNPLTARRLASQLRRLGSFVNFLLHGHLADLGAENPCPRLELAARRLKPATTRKSRRGLLTTVAGRVGNRKVVWHSWHRKGSTSGDVAGRAVSPKCCPS